MKGQHPLTMEALCLRLPPITGQREVSRVISPVVLPGNNVFNVMRKAALFLALQAVLATMRGTLSDELSRGRIHQEEPFEPR